MDADDAARPPGRGYWLFHANPVRSPVLDDLRTGPQEVRRCVTQHRADIRTGDGAVLWLSGASSGVYGIGEVTGDVETDDVEADDVEADDVEADDAEVDQPARRRTRSTSCRLRWSEVRPADPILKPELLATGSFDQARIVRQPMGGNPLRLTESEWLTIQALR